MRGDTPIPIPVPLGGWRTDIPLHQLPLDTLISQPGDLRSFNCFIDFDGLLKPRLGYDVLHNFGERIMGGISWTNSDSVVEIVVATLSTWFRFSPPDAWIPIGGPPNTGDVHFPSRFAVFGFDPVGHKDVLYGCNGAAQNAPGVNNVHRWTLTDVAYTDLLFQGAPFLARDFAVIANRLVFVGVSEQGRFFPQRVRWSAVLDGTNLPPLAYNDLLDGEAGALVAIRLTSRSSAVLYTENGPPYIMSAQLGSDAGAFAFDRIQDGKDGPISASAITNVGGRHFYLAGDQHVYECDGQLARSVSGPIDAFLGSSSGVTAGLDPHMLPGLTIGQEQKPVTLYDKRRQKVWFFVAFFGDVAVDALGFMQGEAFHALCLDLRRGMVWEPPQQFPDAITAAFTLLEQMGPTWDNPGVSAQTTLATAVTSAGTTLLLTSAIGFTASGVVQLEIDGQPTTEQVRYTGKSGNTLTGCVRGGYGTGYGSAAVAHGAGVAVIQHYSWETAPWTSWDRIPSSFESAMYIGTKDGSLCRFFAASSDRGLPIPWSATWGLLNPGPANHLKVNTVDVYINPQQNLILPGSDLFTVVLEGLRTPYDPAPTSILSQGADTSLPDTWFMPVPKDVAAGANLPANYLRFQLMGVASLNGPWYAGASLYAFIEPRPDRGSGFPP